MENQSIQNIEKMLFENNDLNTHFLGIRFNGKIEYKHINDENYYLIGNDYEYELGIKEDTFEVYTLLEDRNIFINKSLEKLIHCINVFFKIYGDIDNKTGEEEIITKVEEIIKEIKKIDNKAINDENNWWSLIIEQIINGEL